MAFPVLRNGGVPSTGTTLPPGFQSGDILISFVIGSTNVTGINAASGWTKQAETAYGTGAPTAALMYKLANGSETTVGHTISAGTAFSIRTIAVVGGTVDFTAGFLATWACGPATASTGTTLASNGFVSAARADSMAIICYASVHSVNVSATITPPSGFTELSDTATTNFQVIEVCYRTTSNAYEGIPTPSATLSSASSKTGDVSIMIVLNPMETRTNYAALI